MERVRKWTATNEDPKIFCSNKDLRPPAQSRSWAAAVALEVISFPLLTHLRPLPMFAPRKPCRRVIGSAARPAYRRNIFARASSRSAAGSRPAWGHSKGAWGFSGPYAWTNTHGGALWETLAILFFKAGGYEDAFGLRQATLLKAANT
jgi:hypothetical protein